MQSVAFFGPLGLIIVGLIGFFLSTASISDNAYPSSSMQLGDSFSSGFEDSFGSSFDESFSSSLDGSIGSSFDDSFGSDGFDGDW